MATLTIDTGDSKGVLLAASNFLAELAGKPPLFAVTPTLLEGDLKPGPIIHVDPAAAGAGDNAQLSTLTAGAADLTKDLNGGQSDVIVELDDSGRIWDKRIDSSSKAKNANGTWKARRSVPVDTRAAVLAELALVATASGIAVTTTPVVIEDGPTAEQVFSKQSEVSIPVEQAVAQATIPATQQPPATGAVLTWPDVLTRMSKAQTGGTLDKVLVDQWLVANNMKAVPLLANRPELFESFIQATGI